MQSKIKKLNGLLKKYCRDTDGATAIEYALLIAVLSVALIASMSLMADTQSTMWNDVSNTFNNS